MGVTYYVSLYIGAKRLVFYLSPRDGHVIIVSGCLILTAVNLIVLIQMVYIGLHEVSVRVGVRYVITKFSRMDSLPNFFTHGAPLRARCARGSSAINALLTNLVRSRSQDIGQVLLCVLIGREQRTMLVDLHHVNGAHTLKKTFIV